MIITRKVSLLLMSMLLTAMVPAVILQVSGAPIAKLQVDPAEVIDPTLIPPNTFDVNITLSDVENLYGYEFNMSYDPNVLTCLYVIVNDVLGETSYTSEIATNNIQGYAWVKVTFEPPAVPITTHEPVTLTTIHFRVKSAGASVLDLHDTNLTDPVGDPIPHDVFDGFVMTVIHDVAITGVIPVSPWAYQGWLLNINVTAKNLGNVSESFSVTTYHNGALINTQPVVDLPPNSETLLIFTWNTTGVAPGNYVISANASTVPFEFNTANNAYVDGNVELLALTAKRDVGITNVVPDGAWVYQGWRVNITVTAENLGDTVETFNVTAYYDSNAIGTVTLIDLAAHTSVNLLFTWNTSGVTPCHNSTVSAEATLVPYEYNVTNNVYVDGTVKIRIVGDVNGDGKVDITDVAMVSAAFGSYPGHPRWNLACDLNRDGRVDITDVAMVSARFGTTCPP